MAGFLGLRSTADFTVTGQRPNAWRLGMIKDYPNGTMLLTGLTSLMPSEKVKDPHFYHFEKVLSTQRAAVTGIYTDVLSTAVAEAAATPANTTLYVKMSAADAANFRAGHQVLLRYSANYTVDVNARVTAQTLNGASSYITVVTLEADDNGVGDMDSDTNTDSLADCDTMLVIGSLNSEGATVPTGITYDPTEFLNYTQIFRSPCQITRTAMETELRTGDAWAEAKREAMEYHGIEMERAFIWGIRTLGTGSNGKPLRTTGGILWYINNYAATNKSDFRTDTDFSGKTWLQAGTDWIDKWLEIFFRYGPNERLAIIGNGTALAIQKLVRANSDYQISYGEKLFGINVMTWLTPFGTLKMKTHPLFSQEATNRNSMLIVSPKDLRYRYVTDTQFVKHFHADGQNYDTSDANTAEFKTECGIELHNASHFGYLNGFGSDSSLGG